jgi:hypothetical protein
MPIKIILRTDQTTNLFRSLFIETACSDIGDRILVCSGFFQERDSYMASKENDFINRFASTKKQITTIGIHNNTWKKDYIRFVNELKKKGINIKAYLYTKYHWHSKIYLLYCDGKPIFGIIGSSNITRNAFSTSKPFNVESDVVLWVTNKNITRIVEQQLGNDENNYYTLNYVRRPQGPTIQDRLEYLDKNVMRFSNSFNLL